MIVIDVAICCKRIFNAKSLETTPVESFLNLHVLFYCNESEPKMRLLIILLDVV